VPFLSSCNDDEERYVDVDGTIVSSVYSYYLDRDGDAVYVFGTLILSEDGDRFLCFNVPYNFIYEGYDDESSITWGVIFHHNINITFSYSKPQDSELVDTDKLHSTMLYVYPPLDYSLLKQQTQIIITEINKK